MKVKVLSRVGAAGSHKEVIGTKRYLNKRSKRQITAKSGVPYQDQHFFNFQIFTIFFQSESMLTMHVIN